MSAESGYRIEGLVVGTRRDGKRRYDENAKGRLIALCMQPGVSLAAVAVSNGLNPNVVRRWVEQVRTGWLRPLPGPAALLPVVVNDNPAATPSVPAPDRSGAEISTRQTEFRIDLAGGTLRFTAPLEATTVELIARGLARC